MRHPDSRLRVYVAELCWLRQALYCKNTREPVVRLDARGARSLGHWNECIYLCEGVGWRFRVEVKIVWGFV